MKVEIWSDIVCPWCYIGLDADETRQMLASELFAAAVRADSERAQALGCTGVPFFVFDEK